MATRKETRSIADLVADVANRKRHAAQVRFAGTSPGEESPRDVYMATCASIGAYLDESFGFKYSKSGPRARRKSGELTFQISFQSDRNNVSGERVGVSVCGTVLQGSKYIAGGQLGNLQENHCWIDWDLADATKREEVTRDALGAIEELALPYFAKFEDLPSLFKLLVNEDFPAMSIDRVVEFLMRFGDQSTARLAAANFLKRRPDLVHAYRHDFAHYAETGLDSKHPSGHAQRLAFASHAFEFGNLTAERC